MSYYLKRKLGSYPITEKAGFKKKKEKKTERMENKSSLLCPNIALR